MHVMIWSGAIAVYNASTSWIIQLQSGELKTKIIESKHMSPSHIHCGMQAKARTDVALDSLNKHCKDL